MSGHSLQCVVGIIEPRLTKLYVIKTAILSPSCKVNRLICYAYSVVLLGPEINMNSHIIQPPLVAWANGAFSHAPVICKITRIQDLAAVFADGQAWERCDPQCPVYTVEMLETPAGEGALWTGVTHLNPGKVGNEFFMTRGHFHARREQGEVYFGLCGQGLLLLQDESGKTRLETVCEGSVHIIPGFTAHRLINTGSDILSALAVWPTIAGHDYAALSSGFTLRVLEENQRIFLREVQNG